MPTLREVPKEEFWDAIKHEKRNVHPRLVGAHGQYGDGYRSDFETQDGTRTLVGRIDPPARYGEPSKYFLA